MPMRLLGLWFRDLAKAETRVVIVSEGNRFLPAGSYGFVELYCDERGCRCDSVMLNVYGNGGEHFATLNHCLTPGGFADLGLPDTFLDPLNRQSDRAQALLDLFRQVVLTPEYAARLRRHRAMVMEKVNGRLRPAARAQKRAKRSPEPRRTWYLRPSSPSGSGPRGGPSRPGPGIGLAGLP